MILCRYTTSDRCIEIIKDQRLYAANPVVDFNDPIELFPGIVGEPDREKLSHYWRNDLRPRLSPVQQQLLQTDIPDEAWERLQRTYRPRLKEAVEENIQDASERLRIICFCMPDNIDDGDDILLWSHYADGHKGVKIYFETKDIKIQSTNLFPVTYSVNRPRIDISDPKNDNAENVYKAILKTKNKSWHYEQEVRWIISKLECLNIDGNLFIPVSPEAIRRIDMGCRCNKIDRIFSELKKNESYKHIKLYKTSVHEYKYSLDYNELDLDNF